TTTSKSARAAQRSSDRQYGTASAQASRRSRFRRAMGQPWSRRERRCLAANGARERDDPSVRVHRGWPSVALLGHPATRRGDGQRLRLGGFLIACERRVATFALVLRDQGLNLGADRRGDRVAGNGASIVRAGDLGVRLGRVVNGLLAGDLPELGARLVR